MIKVEDTGIGIPHSLLARIFEDFFQVTPRGNTHRGGAGLGLGIVQRLSRMLELPVRVESTVGVGTRFTIPQRYTCEGENISPPLAWVGVPARAASLALIVDDPDAPDPAAHVTGGEVRHVREQLPAEVRDLWEIRA